MWNTIDDRKGICREKARWYHCSRMDNQALYKFAPTVLISIVTYLGGLFTEPARKWLNNRTERRRLRNALYAELEANFDHFLAYVSGIRFPEQYPRIAFEQAFRTEVYLEALKQPILFRELHEARTFSDVYELLARTSALPEVEQPAWLEKLSSALPFYIKKGLLSRRLLNRAHASYLPSGYRHPLSIWWGKKYRQITSRNVPPQEPSRPGETGIAYQPASTLFERIKALWRGIPGDPFEVRFAPLPPNAPQRPPYPPL
jgi:hypothetical protein